MGVTTTPIRISRRSFMKKLLLFLLVVLCLSGCTNGQKDGAKGTSYATGYVSAAAALIWQENEGLTAVEISEILLSSSQTSEDIPILCMETAVSSAITENEK